MTDNNHQGCVLSQHSWGLMSISLKKGMKRQLDSTPGGKMQKKESINSHEHLEMDPSGSICLCWNKLPDGNKKAKKIRYLCASS